ncbi:MAG TPA: helix-turn-helix domain-containing protein [Pseudonocardiaceae bacterium]|jgi:AcrR family transcriptional regulator|nr:helix-turn-helix domain-containing protein [Pseudonocardiaceae bacterium]
MAAEQGRGGTREKIQAVALELFAEQGYEKTSLREIAERLGVTKAALYYHFRTKEDIVGSLFDDYLTHIDEIVDWAGGQELTLEIRREIVRRYAAVLARSGSSIMQFVQGNQSAVRDLKDSGKLMDRFRVLGRLLVNPTAPLRAQIRCNMAMAMLHLGNYAPLEVSAATPEERHAATLQVVLELVTDAESAG